MVDKLKKIWMDGEFVDWENANVHILTHSLHYGLGAFEGIRADRTDKPRFSGSLSTSIACTTRVGSSPSSRRSPKSR